MMRVHARVYINRSLRAFRVIRLFGRLGSLRDIIAALTAAVGPVMNAFLIMFIVGAICERLQKPHAHAHTHKHASRRKHARASTHAHAHACSHAHAHAHAQARTHARTRTSKRARAHAMIDYIVSKRKAYAFPRRCATSSSSISCSCFSCC